MIVSSELPVSMTEKHIFLKSDFTSFGISDMTSEQGMRYTSAYFCGLAHRVSLDQPHGMCFTVMIMTSLYRV